jgi:hypothetical protein
LCPLIFGHVSIRPATFQLIVQKYGIFTVPCCGCIMTQTVFTHLLPRGIHIWIMLLYARHFVILFFKLPVHDVLGNY